MRERESDMFLIFIKNEREMWRGDRKFLIF